MTARSAATEALAAAIQTADLAALQHVLVEHPDLASAQLGGRFKTRTALHVVTDWPGYFPNGPQAVHILVGAGADPNARSPGDDKAFWHACSAAQRRAAEYLLSRGADLNWKPDYANNPGSNDT